LDHAKIQALPPAEQKQLEGVQAATKRSAFTTIAILPGFMLVCYIGLFLYFRSRGGYKPIEIGAH
jgi:DHA2 family metal-tetracycline-proton antiporter-like MFS transporter